MHSYTPFTTHPEDIRWGLVASAILDTILCENPANRYHSYQLERLPGVDFGILNHGSGDGLICVFDSRNGCLIKGFDHESAMSPHARAEFKAWPGVLDEVPPELLKLLDDPELRREETTFCIWRGPQDRQWSQGNVVDEPESGEWSANLLERFFLDAEAYLAWASEYYTRSDIPAKSIATIFASCQPSEATVLAINPKADLEMVRRELAAMRVKLK